MEFCCSYVTFTNVLLQIFVLLRVDITHMLSHCFICTGNFSRRKMDWILMTEEKKPLKLFKIIILSSNTMYLQGHSECLHILPSVCRVQDSCHWKYGSNTGKIFFFYHIRTVQHQGIIKVLFIHQLIHKRVVLKISVKIYIKTAPICFNVTVTPSSGSALTLWRRN